MNVKKLSIANLIATAIVAVSLVMIPKQIQAATYQTSYSIIDTQTNQASSIDPFFDKPAQITALGSRYKVTFNIELVGPVSNSQITSLTIDGSPVAVNVLSNSEDDKVSQVTFYTADLQRPLNGSISLSGQNSSYQFQFRFGNNNIPSSNSNETNNQSTESTLSSSENNMTSSSSIVANSSSKQAATGEPIKSSTKEASSNSLTKEASSSSALTAASSSTSKSSDSSSIDDTSDSSSATRKTKHHEATANDEKASKKGTLLNPAVLITIGAVVLIGVFAYWRSVSHK